MNSANLAPYIIKLILSFLIIFLFVRYFQNINIANIADLSKDTPKNIPHLSNITSQYLTLNVTKVDLDLQHFQFLQFNTQQYQETNQDQQSQIESNNKEINAFMIINTNTDFIGYKYLNFLKTLIDSNIDQDKKQRVKQYKAQKLQSKSKENKNEKQNRRQNKKIMQNKNIKKYRKLRIFILTQKKALLLNQQQKNIHQYALQIQKSINYLGLITPNKVNILASQQSSILSLKSLALYSQKSQFEFILKKIDKIMLINLYNLNLKILQSPSYKYLQQLKSKISDSVELLQFFNGLNFIMINTLKENDIIFNLSSISQNYIEQNKNEQFQAYQRQQQHLQNSNILNDNNQTELINRQQNNDHYLHKRYQKNNWQQLSKRFFIFQNCKYNSDIQLTKLLHQMETNTTFNSSMIKQQLEHIQTQYFALNKTIFVHTNQMYNIHAQLNNGQYFINRQFLSILSNFVKQDQEHQMTQKAINYYFKYGQTYSQFPFEFVQNVNIKKCVMMQLTVSEPTVSHIQDKCFKLNVKTQFPNSVVVIYSKEGKFDLYSNSLVKIQQYDNNVHKSLYLIQKQQQNLIINNPEQLTINIAISQIFTPKFPLTQIFTQHQILYINQIKAYESQKTHLYRSSMQSLNIVKSNRQKATNKSSKQTQKAQQDPQFKQKIQKLAIKTCSGRLVIFPDHVGVGKSKRQYLLQRSDSECYNQKNLFEIVWINIQSNWILFRNIFFFSLFFIYSTKQWSIKIFITLFIANSMLLYDSQIKNYQVIIVIALAFIGQKIFNLCQPVVKLIQFDKKKMFFTMLIILIIAFVCQAFLYQKFNYWKIVLMFLIFFINKENVILICIKLYFLKQLIFYGVADLYHLAHTIMLLQISLPKRDENALNCYQNDQNKRRNQKFRVFEQKIKLFTLVTLGLNLAYNPHTGNFKDIIDNYLWIKIAAFLIDQFL